VSGARGARALRRLAVAALTMLLAIALASCGDTTSSPQWVASHPDTSLLGFRTTAPGVCAITVQYPDEAPAAIAYLGNTYVQVQRLAHNASPPGRQLDTSGNWRVLLESGGDLLLVTPGDGFDYRLEPSC
jgi:hypothetical protein